MRVLCRSFVRVLSIVVVLECATAAQPTDTTAAKIEDLTSSIKADPGNSSLFVQRGVAYARQQELAAALADFGKAIELNPRDALAFRHRAQFWSDQRETNNAIRDLDQAIELEPDHAESYALRGLLRGVKQRWDDALSDFDKALELDSSNTEIHFNRALLLGARRERTLAIDELDAVLQLKPDHELAYAFRGWQWLMLGNFQQSIEDYTDVLKLDPRNASAYAHRAIGRMQRRESAKALSDLLMADQLDPRLINPVDIAFVAQELLRSANQKLSDREQDGLDPARLAACHRDRGIANAALERWNEAAKDLNEAIRLDQSSSSSFAVRGRLWLREREWDRAIADFSAAMQLNPRDASLWFDRGTAHAQNQEWTAAIHDFDQANQLDPQDLRTLAQRGMAWQSLGKLDRAMADYQQVMLGAPFYVRAPKQRLTQEQPAAAPVESEEPPTGTSESAADEPPSILASKVGLRLNESGDGAFISENDRDVADASGPTGTNPARPGTWARGIRHWHAVCLDPCYLKVYAQHAKCCEAAGDWSGAMDDYVKLARLAPNDPLAYRRIAWTKATCPLPQLRDGAEAVRFAQLAVDLSHRVEDFVTLAAACAEDHQFASAVEIQSRAMEMSVSHWERRFQDLKQKYKATEFERLVDDDERQPEATDLSAVEAGIEACRQSQWKDAKLIESLAEAQANAGQLEQALASCDQLQELVVAQQGQALVKLQKLYESEIPFRSTSSEDSQMIESAEAGGITARLELLADDELISVSGLPAHQLSIAQIRLFSVHPDGGTNGNSNSPSGVKKETDLAEQKESDLDRARIAAEAALLVQRGMEAENHGQFEKAMQEFQSAIELDPQCSEAYNNLAWLQATCADDRIRNAKAALKNALAACELTDWKAWTHLDTLAAAYAESGDFKLAIQWTETAMELIPFDEADSETERLQKNLDLYRSKQPLREIQH